MTQPQAGLHSSNEYCKSSNIVVNAAIRSHNLTSLATNIAPTIVALWGYQRLAAQAKAQLYKLRGTAA